MAKIEASTCMIWGGSADSKIDRIELINYKNSIKSVIVRTKSGNLFTKFPAFGAFNAAMKYLEPGTGSILFNSNDSDIEDLVLSHVQKDAGRLVPNFIESFTTTGAEGGRYVITTSFKNDKPIYKKVGDVDWYVWYESETEKWIASRAEISKDVKYLENENCLPQYGEYFNESFSEYTQTAINWECVEVTELAGGVADANGLYCQTAFYKSNPVYVSCDEAWFLFFDGVQWVLTDTPFTREGRWLTNSSKNLTELYNNASGNNGSGDFLNQIGKIRSLGIPEGSIRSEDGETFIFGEDASTSITSE